MLKPLNFTAQFGQSKSQLMIVGINHNVCPIRHISKANKTPRKGFVVIDSYRYKKYILNNQDDNVKGILCGFSKKLGYCNFNSNILIQIITTTYD